MTDFARIDRNFKRMLEQNAPDSDLDAYLRGEGVTADQLSQWKSQQQGGNMLTRAASGFWDMVKNKEDPNYADLPTIADKMPMFHASTGWAKATGTDDDGLANIAKTDLGDRYIRTDRDANGFPIVVWRGDDGNEQKAYVNRPVWDWQDIDRGIQGAIPYVVTGGLAGRLANNAGMLTRMAVQGVTGAATSAGQDLAADAMGADRGVSASKAGFAALGGAGGEALGAWVGSILRNRAARHELVTPEGKLSPRGAEVARRAGYDPDEINAEFARQINAEMKFAKDPFEAVSGVATDRFRIPTTLGQRTDDPAQVLLEKDMRAGTLGTTARDRIKKFDEDQTAAINTVVSPNARGSGRVVGDAEISVPARLAPKRTQWGDRSEVDAGSSIREAFNIARETADRVEDAAWKGVSTIRPTARAFISLPTFIQKNMPFQITENLHPATTEMLRRLSGYMKGEAIAPPVPDILGAPRQLTLDQMRRELLGLRKAAKDPSDGQAAKSVYDAFNEWIEDAAERALLQGDANAARALREARATTRELKGLFSPTDRRGLKAPAARILDKMTDADQPEAVISAFVGSASARGALPNGAVDALKRYQQILKRFNPDQAAEAWDDIRLAYWMRLVAGRNGDILGPQALRSNILASLRSRPTLMNTLYTPEEQQMMTEVARALKAATYKDPNPSGTATAMRSTLANIGGGMAKVAQDRARMRRASGSGKVSGVFWSTFYGALAKHLPNIIEQGVFGNAAANRALNQQVARRPLPSMGKLGAAYGAADHERFQFATDEWMRR